MFRNMYRLPTLLAVVVLVMLPAALMTPAAAQRGDQSGVNSGRSSSSSTDRATRGGSSQRGTSVRSRGSSRSHVRAGSQRSSNGAIPGTLRGSSLGDNAHYGFVNRPFYLGTNYPYRYHPELGYPRYWYCGGWPVPYYWGYLYPYTIHWNYYERDDGALDLNIKPKSTNVYLDGQLVGRVGKYDGFPRYLRLQPGLYDLVFQNDGYRTVHRRVEVQQSLVIDMRFEMMPGETISVDEMMAMLPPKPSFEPDEGPRFERMAETDVDADADVPPRRYRQASAQANDSGSDAGIDMRAEPATLLIRIEPEDASVYLDGLFVGVASEIQANPKGIVVNPGEHILEVVRPGYEKGVQDIVIEAGQTLDVDLRLATTEQ